MKKLTNYARGPRGVTLKDGSTVWIEPGETVEIKGEIVEPLPDLGAKPKADEDESRADALEAENAELKTQVADQAKRITALEADLAKAKPPTK